MGTKKIISLKNNHDLVIHSCRSWDIDCPFFELIQEGNKWSLGGRAGLSIPLISKIVQNKVLTLFRFSTESSPATERGALDVLGENTKSLAPFFSFCYDQHPIAAGWISKTILREQYGIRGLNGEKGFNGKRGCLWDNLGGLRDTEVSTDMGLVDEWVKGVLMEREKGLGVEVWAPDCLEDLAYRNQMISSPKLQQVGYYFFVIQQFLQFAYDKSVVN